MQICRRSLRPGELDHELIWLVVSIGAVAMAGIWLSLGLPWPHCLFLTLTGFPCLTCGATRCGLQFFHARFLDAFSWNPLLFFFYWGLVIFDVYAAVVLVTGLPRIRLEPLPLAQKRLIRWLVVGVLLLNWIYLIAHASRYR